VNGDNFGTEKETVVDEVNMDTYQGEDAGHNYTAVELISFGTLQYSTKINHLGFDMTAETLEGVTSLDAYMEYYEAFMLESDNGTEYRLENSGTVTINGTEFEERLFFVDRESDDFYIFCLTTKVKNNYFLNIQVNYWPENTNARNTIITVTGKGLAFY
jgi:hypothetical protein